VSAEFSGKAGESTISAYWHAMCEATHAVPIPATKLSAKKIPADSKGLTMSNISVLSKHKSVPHPRAPQNRSKRAPALEHADAPTSKGDLDFKNRVRAYLRDRGIPSFDKLELDVRQGVLAIAGTVSSPYERQLVLHTARRVAGIVDVDSSQLVVSELTGRELSQGGATRLLNRRTALKVALGITILAGLLTAFVATRGSWPWSDNMYVTGSVLVSGQPAHGAYVSFFPADSDSETSRQIVAIAGIDGHFRLSKRHLPESAKDYVVTLRWYRTGADEVQSKRGPNVISAEYTRPETSPLRVQLAASERSLEPFNVK
jgi:hypothetical protein